jgi:membrane-associated phospholipid phosphatase
MRRIHVFEKPTALDLAARRAALTPGIRALRRPLWLLFPVGMPGGYLMIAYGMSHCLKRWNLRGGSEIVTAAWLGWLMHRAIKVVVVRERPPEQGRRRRFDSFPSGHTTGATSLALTMARVLEREGVISKRSAMVIAATAPAIMGMYRVIADDHWTTDVIAGWVLGVALAATVAATNTRERRPRVRPASRLSAG